MLVVQLTSTCDVCLDRYLWSSTASANAGPDENGNNANDHFMRPHVIACGHVFCYQCLQNIRTPRTCPLCRASFQLRNAVRIHVDPDLTSDVVSRRRSSISGDDGSSDGSRSENDDGGSRLRLRLRLTREEAEVREMEIRLFREFATSAMDFTPGLGSIAGPAPTAASRSTSEQGGDSADGIGDSNEGPERGEEENDVETRRSVKLEEARAWLANANAPPDAHPILRFLIGALPSHVSLPAIRTSLDRLEQENLRLRNEREQLRRHLKRAERVKEQEVAFLRSAEKMKIAEIENHELKLTQSETERKRLEEELARVKVALKDAQAAQSDILVQAHMQIREQGQTQTQTSVPAPTYSPRPKDLQPKSQARPSNLQGPATQTSNPNSTSEILFPRTSSSPSTSNHAQQARNATSISSSASTYPNSYEYPQSSSYSYDYSHRHNPLPPPPEPVPLSHLPAFARPRHGSRAYANAKALARHGTRKERERDTDRERDRVRERDSDRSETRSLRRKEKDGERVLMTMTDSEKDRRERRRDRERERERERERGRVDAEVGADSATSRDRLRGRPSGKDKGKEKDRGTDKGTDTSATETQERRRARTRHASLVGMPSSSSAARPAVDPYSAYGTAGVRRSDEIQSVSGVNNSSNLNGTAGTDSNVTANVNTEAALPRDIVGGWGLERSLRASYASSHSGHSIRSGHSGNAEPSGASASASQEYLPDGLGEMREGVDANASLGSSFTKMRVRERVRDMERDRGGDAKCDDELTTRDKGKGRERERETDKEDYVFVRSARDEADRIQSESSQHPRERHVSFTTAASSYPFPSSDANPTSEEEFRDTTHELPPLQPNYHSSYAQLYSQAQTQRGERERRTTLSAVPSALGLVLVPSPDGKGGYTYEYQYRYHSPGYQQQQQQQQHQGQPVYGAPTLPPQSTIQPPSSTGSASANGTVGVGGFSGKESVTPLASLTQAQTAQERGINTLKGGVVNASNAANVSRASEYATLTRRATDSSLRSHSQARAGLVANSSSTAASTTAGTSMGTRTTIGAPLHFPQPRRISLTIPEPESETSPQSQGRQNQSSRADGVGEALVGKAYKDTEIGSGYYANGQQQIETRMASLYSNTNPNANMTLDSALASIPLGSSATASGPSLTSNAAPRQLQTQPQTEEHTQTQTKTLRHRTSNSSTASASSTGISLTGATKGERRKQLLDALFSASDDSERDSGRVGPAEVSGSNNIGNRGRGRDGRHGGEARKAAGAAAATSTGMNTSWSGGGKRVSLGRVLDAASSSTSTTTTMNGTVAKRDDATHPTSDAPLSQGQTQSHTETHGQTQGQTLGQAPRGVPSRDGRPSRGLSTRPSTTQPVSSSYGHYQQQSDYRQQHQHQQQYATSGYSTQQGRVRQATYPAATYASSSASLAQTQAQMQAPAVMGATAYAYPTATVAYQVPASYAHAHGHVPATYSAAYYAASVPHSTLPR